MRLALVLGAGWSYRAGLPLASQLFDEPVGGYTDASTYRSSAVITSFASWRRSRVNAHAEQFVAEAYRGDVELIAGPFPERREQLQLEALKHLPWSWVVEYIQVRLALPVVGETRRAPVRYAPQMHMPTRSVAQQRFWAKLQHDGDVSAVVTTNYDLLAERTMRHRPMKRPHSPGFQYGGLNPVWIGSRTPFGRERRADPAPTGLVPLYKMHGSLNWSLDGPTIVASPDVRAAFRDGGSAAIVPPLPEKEIPRWLTRIWVDAERALAAADRWIVVGYSMPEYDTAVHDLLCRAAAETVRSVCLHDPHAEHLAPRWQMLRDDLTVVTKPGL